MCGRLVAPHAVDGGRRQLAGSLDADGAHGIGEWRREGQALLGWKPPEREEGSIFENAKIPGSSFRDLQTGGPAASVERCRSFRCREEDASRSRRGDGLQHARIRHRYRARAPTAPWRAACFEAIE